MENLIYYSTDVILKGEKFKREVDISIDVSVSGYNGELFYADIVSITDVLTNKSINKKQIENIDLLEQEIWDFCEKNTIYLLREYSSYDYEDSFDSDDLFLERKYKNG